MTDLIAAPVFIVSVAATLFSAILIGRYVFKTGLEHFSSRMLILTGVLNAFFCIFLIITHAFTTTSASIPERLLYGLLSMLIPARVVWNYWVLPRNIITQFNLSKHDDQVVRKTITSISITMDVAPPQIMSSESVKIPFIFGRQSSTAILAIPSNWHTADDLRRNSILLHELAHIHNHDVGFLAWSQACLKDLRWLLTGLPSLIALGYLFGQSQIVSSLWIYITCLISLYSLLKYILRKRESLADMTAVLLIESSHIKEVISSDPTIADLHLDSIQTHKNSFLNILYRWLTDKALFSKNPKFYTVLLKAIAFFQLSHPKRSTRADTVSSINQTIAKPQIALFDSFWAGITLGFWGVTIGLCGYWFSDPSQYALEDIDCLRLSYTLYGLAAPLAVGFWVIFITLPFWASLGSPNMDKLFFKTLLKQHGVAFGGAFIISLLVLTAGPLKLHFQILCILCILWQLLITLMGFCVSIVSVFIWNVIRYLQATTIENLRKTLWTFIPLLMISLGGTLWGMFYISNNRVFQGANLIFSTLTGIVVFLKLIGRSRFSDLDQYMTVSSIFFTYRIEGKNFQQQYKLIDLAVIPLFLLLPIFLFYSGIIWLFDNTFGNLSVRSAIISLIIISCIILVLIQLSERGKARITRRPKIHRLFHCLKLLSEPQTTEILHKMSHIAASYCLKGNETKRPLNLTTNDVYEMYQLTKGNCPGLSDTIIKWSLQCQQPGGLGLWPQSSPRLISTYQALSILKDSDRMDSINSSGHTSWIKSCQQQNGSFKSPWSKRKTWQDTFYAVQSLNFLNLSLKTGPAELCLQYCHGILSEGIAEDQIDKVYYAVAAMDALGKLDNNALHKTSDWLSGKIEKLLLVNIGLNYENVHLAVMTYHILNQIRLQSSMDSQIALLTERIQSALEAELADIRCK